RSPGFPGASTSRSRRPRTSSESSLPSPFVTLLSSTSTSHPGGAFTASLNTSRIGDFHGFDQCRVGDPIPQRPEQRVRKLLRMPVKPRRPCNSNPVEAIPRPLKKKLRDCQLGVRTRVLGKRPEQLFPILR